MPQYALICRDAPDALERRMAARAAHMAGLKIEKSANHIVDGGAMLDAEGNMVGSVVLCRFDDRAGLDAYLGSGPINRVAPPVAACFPLFTYRRV